MQVVILAGGLGSRLNPQGFGVPKALREISGKTILEWQLMAINNPKVEVLLLIGEEKNRSAFINIVKMLSLIYGNQIKLVTEEKRMGTLGAIVSAEQYLENEFVVLLGDILLDYPIVNLLSEIKKSKSQALVVVRETDHPEDSDVFEIDSEGKVIRFSHYPHTNKIEDGVYVGLTGLYAFKRSFIKGFEKKAFIDIWESMSSSKKTDKKINLVFTFHNFKDIGTQKRLEEGADFSKKLKFSTDYILYLVDRDDTLMVDPGNSKFSKANLNQDLVEKLNYISTAEKNSIVCITTNQPVIAKGFKSVDEVVAENEILISTLVNLGLNVSSIKFCPHHPERGFEGEVKMYKKSCFCRKPLPGMGISVVQELGNYPERIVVYGDSHFDYFYAKNMRAEFRWVFFKTERQNSRIKAAYKLAKKISSGVGYMEAVNFLVKNYKENKQGDY